MNHRISITFTTLYIISIVSGLSVSSVAGNETGTNTEAEQHYEKAYELRKATDYDAAIAEYEKVIHLAPNSKMAQDAQYWIGQSYFELKRFDAALSAFQSLLDKYPASSIAPSAKQMIERVQQAKKKKALFEAVKKADVEKVKSLIAQGADIDARWRDVYNENEGENISSRNRKWRNESTPLCHAVNVGTIEVVKLLVEAGADVNAEGWPPLCRAVDENNTAIAEYLIDHGANVNVYPVEGWGPLQETVHISNSIEMVKLLIARGADINSKVYPVLNSAINQERKDLCEFLIERGADVNAKDKWGHTPLHYAIRKDDLYFMNILLANDAEVDIRHPGGYSPHSTHSEGETLLHYAAIEGRTEAVKLLLEAGAKVDEKDDESGFTALHHAARFGKKNAGELLIARGADINARDKKGHTPLQVAVNHDYQVAELLINKGADSSIRTESGKTLFQLAQERKRTESMVPDMIFDGDPNSWFGAKTVCCDVDGDGYDDVLIGAFRYNNNRGRVYLFYGGPDMDTNADLILEGQNEGDIFGGGIACGDIDNDGYDDIVIGAGGYEKQGLAYLYWGSDRNSMDANPDKSFAGDAKKGSRFGVGYPAVYDIDNDGYDDIILGSYFHPGRAYLYYGNTKELMDTSADLIFTGEGPRDWFGFHISCGDVDNDGYGDIVIGPKGSKQGRTYLYYGDSKWNIDAKADVIFQVKYDGYDTLGGDIECVDQNGDGYDDIIIGAGGFNDSQGRAYLFHGNSKKNMDSDPDLIFEGEVEDIYYGTSEVCGDIDGDNVNDIVIGARWFRQGIGRVYVYWGKELTGPDPKPGRILTGEHPKDEFGYGLACGDVNNDGFDDLVIGACGYKSGAKQGRAYLYYGGPRNK